MAPLTEILGYGTAVLNIILLIALFVYIYNRFTDEGLSRFEYYNRLTRFLSDHYRELAFLTALSATSGSLYLSNLMGLKPCRLCWFQRIFMYPLTVIIPVSILFDSGKVRDYVIPLCLLGLPIAVYHYAIQRVDQFQSAGCSVASVSCESTQIPFYAGYVSIPMMAATAFAVILVLMWKFSSDR